MVEAGLVERRPDPDDRRGTRVALTRRGRSAIDRALAAHLANEEALLADVTDTDRHELDRLLRVLLAGLEARG
jgi:DNA-binding MarR family transcriptional regulator